MNNTRARAFEAPRAAVPAPALPRVTELEAIEYESTVVLDVPPNNIRPVPPPGAGWRLVTTTFGNGRLYRDWARKVTSNA